ncbi:MAG: hypothetical protein KGL39_33225 [Patescibacteria group bacterium]|nr:hypothetical protein [Patescibacteria group bacterium]
MFEEASNISPIENSEALRQKNMTRMRNENLKVHVAQKMSMHFLVLSELLETLIPESREQKVAIDLLYDAYFAFSEAVRVSEFAPRKEND